MNIKLLSDEVIGQIAGGEVIDRPSGILKELLENSLDAGATHITITVEDAGKSLIRVHDNGEGISPEELPLSLQRHATSKITQFNDLDNLSTFGFRGEGLYSISAVSRLTIQSTYKNSARKIEAEGGKIISNADAPATGGTAVEVRDLFFNVPARLKFLKSNTTENNHLIRTFEETALANTQCSFKFYNGNKEVYSFPSEHNDEKSLFRRISKIFGHEISDKMICIDSQSSGFKMRAFVSKPVGMITSRNMQFFFVNKRPVASKIMQQAVYKAYENLRVGNKHPAVVLFIETMPENFDVNIHPQKRDIRFQNENAVFSLIYSGINTYLTALDDAPALLPPSTGAMPAKYPKIDEQMHEDQSPYSASAGLKKAEEKLFQNKPRPALKAENVFDPKAFLPPGADINLAQNQEEPRGLNIPLSADTPHFAQEQKNPSWWQAPYTFLGQIDKTYLVFENASGLMLIDQHAAQERIYFEQYLEEFSQPAIAAQKLMFPVEVTLAANIIDTVMEWSGWLNKAGFEITRFSPRSVQVHTVPLMFKFDEEGVKNFIISLSEIMGDSSLCTEEVKRNLVALKACKKAVKAHEKLREPEAVKLLFNLKKCGDGLRCPHGRPTMLTMTTSEIAKRFLR